MEILFVVADLYFGEPIGIMALSAICKREGHTERRVKSNSMKNGSLSLSQRGQLRSR